MTMNEEDEKHYLEAVVSEIFDLEITNAREGNDLSMEIHGNQGEIRATASELLTPEAGHVRIHPYVPFEGLDEAMENTALPGAYYVTEIDSSSESPDSTLYDLRSERSNAQTEDLPVATPAPAQTGDENLDLYNGIEELVVEGVVVKCNLLHKRQRYIDFFIAMITILITVGAVWGITMHTQRTGNHPYPEKNLQNVTLSPNLSHTDYVRQILLPIAGKDVLNDPVTFPYFSWQKLSVRTDITDPERIIQIYAIFVSTQILFDLPFHHSIQNNDECLVFECDDNGKITAYIAQNSWLETKGSVIPSELGLLKDLTHLILPHNKLVGTIPTELGLLRHLQTLDLQKNFLTGTIPTELGTLHSLEWLLVNNNLLESKIPTEISMLSDLFYMNLSQNMLTGSIPSEFTNLTNLQGLTLNENEISGNIDFMCDIGMQYRLFQERVDVGKSLWVEHLYVYSAELGLVMGCKKNDTSHQCNCCICKYEDAV